jgi:GNAT superfamily N-acetyltransferase
VIELRERDFEAFFAAPFDAYGEQTPYISPMKSDLKRFFTTGENPLFPSDDLFTWFTAHRDGKVLGRICAHVHAESNALHKLNAAYFGYFDCADDAEAAGALLGAAEGWARARGHDSIAGNFNLTAMQQIGVTTGGYEATPYVDQVYSPPHLAKLLEANGYTAFFPMQTFEVDLTVAAPSKGKADFASGDWTFATISRKTIPQRLEESRLLLNDGFAKNPMFVPLTTEEFDFQAKELKWIIDPRITAVIHHKGEPAAVVLVIPDLNPFIRATRSRINWLTPLHFIWHLFHRDRALLVYVSVKQEYQGKGLMTAMMGRVLAALRKAGYRKLGITWVWDGNTGSLKQMERIGAKPLHRMHLFRKALK